MIYNIIFVVFSLVLSVCHHFFCYAFIVSIYFLHTLFCVDFCFVSFVLVFVCRFYKTVNIKCIETSYHTTESYHIVMVYIEFNWIHVFRLVGRMVSGISGYQCSICGWNVFLCAGDVRWLKYKCLFVAFNILCLGFCFNFSAFRRVSNPTSSSFSCCISNMRQFSLHMYKLNVCELWKSS